MEDVVGLKELEMIERYHNLRGASLADIVKALHMWMVEIVHGD